MQATVEEHWERMADPLARPPDDPEDFGFYHPVEYVLETAQIFIISGGHTLPRAGGWDDQDYLWSRDLLLYLRGVAYAKYLSSPEGRANQVHTDTNPADWGSE